MFVSAFRQTFSNPHVILPVIHVETLPQAMSNTAVAREAGADGVFLINHRIPCSELLAIHHEVCRDNPDWWIGVNCLGLPVTDIFSRISPNTAGVWVDNAHIDEENEEQEQAERIAAVRRKSGWTGLYFGGVAFKYQRPVVDLERAARLATRYMDVVTTSGKATGSIPEVAKIARLKQAIGAHPLAIASGITPENVTLYLPIADCFMVATGISSSFSMLNPQRVQALVSLVRNAGGAASKQESH